MSVFDYWREHHPEISDENAPGEYYKSELWAIEKDHTLEMQGGMCQRCGYDKNLHVHHIYGLHSDEYEVLCADCHAEHHGNPEIGRPKKTDLTRCKYCEQWIRFKTPRKHLHAYNLDGTRHKC